jgi:hypothetical protein
VTSLAATVLVLCAFLGLPLAILGLAIIDNKRRPGNWLSRDRKTDMDAPLPFERLSAADRDAWLGGHGGN